MNLPDVFSSLRPSIVAFGSRLASTKDGKPPAFLPIIGTGFVVHGAGVVVTNRHVAEALSKLPREPSTNRFLGCSVVFSPVKEDRAGHGLDIHLVDIHGFQMLSKFTSTSQFYGESLPDIAFGQLRIRDLPPVKLATDDWYLRIGMEVATAGFPLGEDPLIVNGVVAQGTPLLRRGIVSGVNPLPCPQPHGFTIDIMSQGGASGSPIFRTDSPEVVGILYAGFSGTNITFGVPSLVIQQALSWFLESKYVELRDVPTLDELRRSQGSAGLQFATWNAV